VVLLCRFKLGRANDLPMPVGENIVAQSLTRSFGYRGLCFMERSPAIGNGFQVEEPVLYYIVVDI